MSSTTNSATELTTTRKVRAERATTTTVPIMPRVTTQRITATHTTSLHGIRMGSPYALTAGNMVILPENVGCRRRMAKDRRTPATTMATTITEIMGTERVTKVTSIATMLKRITKAMAKTTIKAVITTMVRTSARAKDSPETKIMETTVAILPQTL